MDLPENAASAQADAYVALVQKQMKRLSEELAEGQEIEVIVPIANGGQVFVTWLGYENPDMIKVTGMDADGKDVCLLAHKNTLQVLLRRSNIQSEAKPQTTFQLPSSNEPKEISLDETA